MDLTRSYKDLLDLWFADPLHDDYKIKKMDEKIRLKVTRFGVELETEAEAMIMLGAAWGAKYFILNNDFWIILK